jgi:hypothetical protein
MTDTNESMLDTIALIQAFLNDDHAAIDLYLPAGRDLPRGQAINLAGLTAAAFASLAAYTKSDPSDLLRAAAQIVISDGAGPSDPGSR